ncbi:MAG: Chromosomal replication initiator protein DnaA [Chlamydiales bacterium]|nr:Chromosomal replication initiator protein DnaA [Chlamydiales bacterium]
MRAWEEFLTQQEKELGKETVDKWLRPLQIVRFDACNLYLEAADSFKSIWFEEHMRHRVQTRLFNNNHKQIKVHIAIAAQEEGEKTPQRRKKQAPASFAAPAFQLNFDELDSHSQFETYVSSSHNLLAYKLLCESCALNSDTLQPLNAQTDSLCFNPIYLFGRSGVGKTHLMMATASKLQKSGKKVLYVRADTFTEHVVGAIRSGEMQAFRKAYRNVDALLIDDIEVFSRKGATQEELFHTFNTLHVENKQIVLSAGCPPQELKFIEPRLVSRFEWGIVIPLHMAGKQEMETILLQKAEKVSFPLETSVKDFLIHTFGNSTKNLIRALEALILRTHLNKGLGNAPSLPLSLKVAEHYLADLIQEEEKAVLTPGKIIRTVAEFYGIRMDDILSKSQARECALPRQIAMHLCRQELNLPFMKIGDIFARDHSTVMASVKQIQKGLEIKNHEMAGSVKGILKLLENHR